MPERPKRLVALAGALLLTIVLTANLMAANYRYPLYESLIHPHGATLAVHSQVPATKVAPRVVFLGNSVLQYTNLAHETLARRRRVGDHFEFEAINFAMVGSSFADYLFAYRYVRDFDPDLLVVHLTPHTFDNREPLLRTDLKGAVLMDGFRELLDVPAIRRAYSRDDLVSALVYGYFPVYRFAPLWKSRLRYQVDQLTGTTVMDYFPWNVNLAQEWRETSAYQRNAAAARFRGGAPGQYAESDELVDHLFEELERDGIAALFVVQERDPTLHTVFPVETRIGELVRAHPRHGYADFSALWAADEFADHLHPNPKGAAKGGVRMLAAIRAELARLGEAPP